MRAQRGHQVNAVRFGQGRCLALANFRVVLETAAMDVPRDRFAFVVGITGHRDLAPEYAIELRTQFDAILTGLTASYPNTPLVVMSSLAAGADLLAVDVALQRGVPVIACLPMEPDEFAKDFTIPEERARFRAAVSRCRVEVVSTATDRIQAYIDTSMYVAYYSDLVVAFWDGLPGRGRGGTSDVVTLRMSGMLDSNVEFASIPYLPDVGPVYHLVTPRAGEAIPEAALSLIKRYPERPSQDENFQKEFEDATKRLDGLNCDLGRVPSGGTTILGLHDRTDAVCNALQRRTFFCLYILYATAIIATAAQYVESPLLKYLAFPFAFIVYKIAQRNDFENRYQDYRALAEGLRVQGAWFAGGLKDQAERCYLGMQQRELQWIRMALRYAYLTFHAAASGGNVESPECQSWIADQWRYFKTKPRREETWLGRLQLASRIAFYVAIAASLVCFAILSLPTLPQSISDAASAIARFAWLPHVLQDWLNSTAHSALDLQTTWDHSPWENSPIYVAVHGWDTTVVLDAKAPGGKSAPHHDWLVRLSTGVLALYAAVALLISNYCDKRGFAQNIRRYDRMFLVYDLAKRHFDTLPVKNSPAGIDVVSKLGRDALAENGDWLLTRRERPLNFVS
jgi:hypothetical protein